MKRLLVSLPTLVCALVLGLPASSLGRNNLNLIPGPGIHFGIVKRGGTTIAVTLERSGKAFDGDLNDNNLLVNDVQAGTVDARPAFDGTEDGIPFTEAFPQGAYELVDQGRDLLASRGCLQQKALGNSSWDGSRVYCDKTGVEKIKIAGSNGNDVLLVDLDVTASVRFKCRGAQLACGRSCLDPARYTCCDPTPPGFAACWVAVGDTGAVDTTFCEP